VGASAAMTPERDAGAVSIAREVASKELAALDAGGRDTASPVAGLAHSDATERIARVLRLQDAGGDRPVSSVVLRLDTPDGGEDRIRIDMRGRAIGATLDVADPRSAEQLRQHVGELQQALQRQGLEGESMIVRTAQRTTDATTLTASAISAERDVLRAASASASDGGGSTAKDSRTPPRAPFEREFGREGNDQQRSRQRRDGKGDTR
ncbi:MAG TPA: flagellar hook-length control protein FliK, partial [Gemmatimonadaceae bacterium]|nr:flagellar hook-length control protein FliK [Gemmatimonadaceae bacterium]